MQTSRHLRLISQKPEQAQISNFQVKLEFITAAVDRLLLVPRQQPWKIVPGEGTDTDTDTDTGDVTGLL